MADSGVQNDANFPQWSALPAELRRKVILTALLSDPGADKRLQLVAQTEQKIVAGFIKPIEDTFHQAFRTQSRNEARTLITNLESSYGKKFIESLVKTRPAVNEKVAALRRWRSIDDRQEAAQKDLLAQLGRIEDGRRPSTAERLRQAHKATEDGAFDQAYDDMVTDIWEQTQEERAGNAAIGNYSRATERALRRLFDSPALRELEQTRNQEFKPLADMLVTGTRSEALANVSTFMDEEPDDLIASPPPHLCARLWALEQYEWLENRLDAAKVHLVEGSHPASEVGYLHAVNGTEGFHRVVEEWFDTYMRDAKDYLRAELGTPVGRELTQEDVRYVRTRFDLPSIRPRLDSMLLNALSSGGIGSELYRRDLQETAWARHSGDPRTETEIPAPYRSFQIVLERERPVQERADDAARGQKRTHSEAELPANEEARQGMRSDRSPNRSRDRTRSTSR